MSKYIDADKLKKLIDEKWKELADKGVKVGGGKYETEIYTYLSVLRLIDSLQEEQTEVDFDDEFAKFNIGMYNPFNSRAEIYDFARHFYELGLNAKNSQK